MKGAISDEPHGSHVPTLHSLSHCLLALISSSLAVNSKRNRERDSCQAHSPTTNRVTKPSPHSLPCLRVSPYVSPLHRSLPLHKPPQRKTHTSALHATTHNQLKLETKLASITTMASGQERSELDARARQGETVIPSGTGGKSLEAQEHLAEGRSRGGQTRREQLGSEGYQELGHRGGQTRKEQIGTEGYQEMGRKGGMSTMEESGGERAAREGVDIDESKFRK